MTETDWGFSGSDDARAYLGEVRRLWVAWTAALAALVFVDNLWVLVAGAAAIGLLLWFGRPLQARAARVVPEDSVVGGRWGVVGKGTARDRALREFAYGKEPLAVAVEMTSASSLWLTARVVVVGTTVAAFLFVLLTLFGESGQA